MVYSSKWIEWEVLAILFVFYCYMIIKYYCWIVMEDIIRKRLRMRVR